jgi:hypothetical protein
LEEHYPLRAIWNDLALPDLACGFKLAIGPTRMILAFLGVLAVCTLGFVMDICTRGVATGPVNTDSAVFQTELDEYLKHSVESVKKTKDFINANIDQHPQKGVFSTLWSYFSGRFHEAATRFLDLGDSNIYSNIKYALGRVWLCVRAVGWAFRFHPIYSVTCFTAAFLVFVFVGGAMSRCAALEFAKAERPGLFESLNYARQNYRSFVSAPLLPLGMVGLFAFVVMGLGMVAAIPHMGELLMVLMFGFVLLLGFWVTLMVLGTLAGGLLLFPSIAYEKTTGADSIGRAFNYVLKYPVWMLYYVLVSAGLGTFFYLLLRLLIFWSLCLTYRLLSAGMGMAGEWEKMERIWPKPHLMSFLNAATQPAGWSESVTSFVIHLFMLGIVGILLSYIVSYFFSSAAVIYALMRKKVDKIEMNRIYLHLEQVKE